MSEFDKTFEDLFESFNGVLEEELQYRDVVILKRKLGTLSNKLTKTERKNLFDNKKAESEILKLNVADFKNESDYNKAVNDITKKYTEKSKKDLIQIQREFDDILAKYNTAKNLEIPRPTPTLSEEYEENGGFNSSHGQIHPMHFLYKKYKPLSNIAKTLYEEIRRRGNSGEILKFDNKQSSLILKGIKANELSVVMKLAISMGYKLDDTLFFLLGELSPRLANEVDAYDGANIQHKGSIRFDHPYYTNIYNQYLNKYEGNEEKAKNMTLLYRKKMKYLEDHKE